MNLVTDTTGMVFTDTATTTIKNGLNKSKETAIPIPLLSLTLSLQRISTSFQNNSVDTDTTTNGNISRISKDDESRSSRISNLPLNPLLHSCLKRQLMGTIVNYNNNNNNTRNYVNANTNKITIHTPKGIDTNSNKQDLYYEFTVDNILPSKGSVTTSPSSMSLLSEVNETHEHGVYIILPSTRITFISDSNHSKNHHHHHHIVYSKNSTSGSKIHPLHTSNNAKLILSQTIQAIRSYNTIKLSSHQSIQPSSSSSSSSSSPPLYHGVDIPRAFIFSGPPGVGKTHAVKTIIQETNHFYKTNNNIPFNFYSHSLTRLFSIRGSELLSIGPTPSDSAMALQHLFLKAASFCDLDDNHISIIFLDECDAFMSFQPMVSILALMLDQLSHPWDNYASSFPTTNTYRNGTNIRHNDNNYYSNGWSRIIVVAATNRMDAFPESLRRQGRFDKEICMTPPNALERFQILLSLLQQQYHATLSSSSNDHYKNTNPNNHNYNDNHSESGYLNVPIPAHDDLKGLQDIANACVGYVAADLSALVRKATLIALDDFTTTISHNNNNNNHYNNEHPNIIITIPTLQKAMHEIGASALRDSRIHAPPKTHWDDIAGDAGGAKLALMRAVEWPQTKKDDFERLGLTPPRGILLHGPPGCAKTTLARAAAGASGVAFLSLSPADVYASSYVGEAEAVVRRAFAIARAASPCIIFFDEIDSIVGTSSSSSSSDQNRHGMGRAGERGTSAEARVLSTFLNEMDGVDGSIQDGVLLLGATNRPSTIDAALLRPGRFDHVIYVPPPDKLGRRQILEAQVKVWRAAHLVDSVKDRYSESDLFIDIDYLASDQVTGLMTGAEIIGGCREASMLAIRESLTISDSETDYSVPIVLQRHIEESLKRIKPLLSDARVLEEYTSFDKRHL